MSHDGGGSHGGGHHGGFPGTHHHGHRQGGDGGVPWTAGAGGRRSNARFVVALVGFLALLLAVIVLRQVL